MKDLRPMQQEKIRLTRTGQSLPRVDIDGMPEFMEGSVWLAGAGAGDVGLLTLLAAHAIACADVLVYDALVSEDILSLAPARTEIIYAGKRGGKESARQSDISALLVEHARARKRVLRLKGGDPLIFGRGGEEADVLVRAGIPFRIIPGVSAAQAAAAYSGIPLTHRDTNHVVSFVTGHQYNVIDWAALSRAAPVIVIYMGLRQIDKIAQLLMAAGRAADEKAAIIAHASTPAQRVIGTSLGNIAADAYGIEPPALIIIGAVASYHERLNWFASLQGVRAGSG